MRIIECTQHEVGEVEREGQSVLSKNKACGVEENMPRVSACLGYPVQRIPGLIDSGRVGEEALRDLLAFPPEVLAQV